ncbi:anaerobic carbon-monoxide dehydrogenase catalytic subunit [Thermosulfurimonas sp.]|uniref:anaerobic carbon-monoxide dehydrogenase catalytic subunit n=1 Tax=Thermosulfurimonas sp. TaxID=2080236 RepID=UPI0025DADC9A|nr:anaerobic carbon-monoxide dehydrogenase catalytic subunit [Thermosulfurimonas sp.]
MDTRARSRKKSPPRVQNATAQIIYERLGDEVLTTPARVERRGTTPCLFGKGGTCCRVCNMGPCQVVEGVEELRGVCGASAATVVARNFGRMVAGGASAHSDHGRQVAIDFYETVHGETPFEVKDKRKLRVVAQALGLDPDKEEQELLKEMAEAALRIFGQQEGEIPLLNRAPEKRKQLWKELGVWPRGVDREVVELTHRTTIGVDQDHRNIFMACARTALADGWGGSMVATEFQDLMFGNPGPIKARVNIGLSVIREDMVNVAVHGHEPVLAEALAIAASDPEIVEEAKKVGAKGVNLAGICCTGNEILMRRGIPVAGSFLQQEAAIATGALEAVVVDVQCIMQNVVEVAKHFHTVVITTNPRARMEGSTHIEFDARKALDCAKQILREAIARFPKRDKARVNIPDHSVDVVVGFSHETILYMLGGRFRASYKPLNENIINGKILGVAAIVGCDNFRVTEEVQVELAKELIANNVLVLTTGCAATGMGRAGLLRPEAAEMAGDSLREVLEAVGCPPVLHMGSCVDNSRILIAATEMVNTGGLGEDISDLPVIGSAPQWMSEKAITIGQYFVASGATVVFGPDFPTLKSQVATDFLFHEMERIFGAGWRVARSASEFASIMIDHIKNKRKALGIDKPKPRVLYDMAMRRALESPKVTSPFHGLGCFGPVSLRVSPEGEEKKAA